MAAISGEELSKVANIARLKLSDSEAASLKKDLNSLLDYFSKINEIEGKGKELYYVKESAASPREDEEGSCREAEAIRKGFAREKDGYMIAPKSL